MSNKSKKSTKMGATALVALLVVSAISGVVVAAAASVALENVTSETDSNGNVNVAFDVNASASTYNVSLTKIEAPDGTTVNLSSTVEAGNIETVHTGDGTDDSANIYTNLTGSTDMPLNGTVTLYYTHNGTSYTDTVTYDFDADDDGTADSNDKYPNNAPTTYNETRADGETVTGVAIEAYGGHYDAVVYGINSTDGSREKITSFSSNASGDMIEMDSVSVSTQYDNYSIDVEGNATIDSVTLLYDSTSGGGSTSSNADTGALVGAVLILGGVMFVLRRD